MYSHLSSEQVIRIVGKEMVEKCGWQRDRGVPFFCPLTSYVYVFYYLFPFL